jgi:hypothetical protein
MQSRRLVLDSQILLLLATGALLLLNGLIARAAAAKSASKGEDAQSQEV